MAQRRHFISGRKVKLARRDRMDEETLADQKIEDLEAELDPSFVTALNEDVDQLHRGIRPSNIRGQIPASKLKVQKIENVEIGTNETQVGHSLGMIPAYYHVIKKSAGYFGSAPDVWETRAADQSAIYLQADAPVFVDVIVRG